MTERRSIERFSMELQANISRAVEGGNEMTCKCTTSNISSRGGFFLMEEPLPVETPVNIDIWWPPEDLETDLRYGKSLIKVTGHVVRSEKRGMAIGFDRDVRFLKMQ